MKHNNKLIQIYFNFRYTRRNVSQQWTWSLWVSYGSRITTVLSWYSRYDM